MSTLKLLEDNRRHYQHISWLSSNGVKTRIINMETSYIVNVMRKVAQKLVIAREFSLVSEFQTYNGVAYEEYSKAFYNEYLYRQAVIDNRINKSASDNQELEDYLNSHNSGKYIWINQ